jgi:hypothetical protein
MHRCDRLGFKCSYFRHSAIDISSGAMVRKIVRVKGNSDEALARKLYLAARRRGVCAVQ